MRLRALIEKDRYGLSQIADAVSADAALAAALLRIANSAVYQGDGPPLTTLPRAVNRLGARAVSSLALAAGIGSLACAPGPLADVKYRAWRRSITTALAAQRFGTARGVDPEVAFLAGLLYGFGRSVAVACIEKVLSAAPEQHSVPEWLELVERHRAPLAERVARLWQLPAPILAAMSGDSSPAGTLVAKADQLAGALDRGASAEEIAREIGFEDKLASQLRTFVTHLPGALETFVHAPSEPKKGPQSRAPSAVRKSDSLLPGELRSFSQPVVDLRKGSAERFDAVAISPHGLVVTSHRPLHESSVIRLSLPAPESALEAWFNVVLCAPEQKHFRIELQAFAASDDLRTRLGQLWGSAPPLARP
jgi:HD-like signal output (HDOD) protein